MSDYLSPINDLAKREGLVYRSFKGDVENFTEQHKPLVEVVLAKITELNFKHRLDLVQGSRYNVRYLDSDKIEVLYTVEDLDDAQRNTHITVHTISLTDPNDVGFVHKTVFDIMGNTHDIDGIPHVITWNRLYLMACGELLLDRNKRHFMQCDYLTRVTSYNISQLNHDELSSHKGE